MAKILVIDDEKNFRITARLMLTHAGHVVETASDGVQGLAVFGDGTGWDLTLVDQRMPRLEGREVILEARRRDPVARVVMMTAFATSALAAEVLQTGALDFLCKPFSTEVLQSVVDHALAYPSQLPSQLDFAQDEAIEDVNNLPGPGQAGFSVPRVYWRRHGYSFWPAPAWQAPPPQGLEFGRLFQVRKPGGDLGSCFVSITPHVCHQVQQEIGRDVPENDPLWENLCAQALLNAIGKRTEVLPAVLPVYDVSSLDDRRKRIWQWLFNGRKTALDQALDQAQTKGQLTGLVNAPVHTKHKNAYKEERNAERKEERTNQITARLLLIDETRNIQKKVSLALERDGYYVEVAEDGLQGLTKFGDGTHWDLVLLDQKLPILVGQDVLAEMMKRRPEARVVMITAFATLELAADVIAAGAVGFLCKPFSMESLRRTVEAALRGKQATPATPLGVQFPHWINGFMIRAVPEQASDLATPAFEVRRFFLVSCPQSGSRRITVGLTPETCESVRQRVNSHLTTETWDMLCRSAISNYLWIKPELPPPLLPIYELNSSQVSDLDRLAHAEED
jgi:DNA-binding response OmpR family regulator